MTIGGGGGAYKPANEMSKTADFIQDPLNIIPHTGAGNQLRRAQVDPLGLFYDPPERVQTEAELAAEEESRKSQFRKRIDKLYGIGDDSAKAALDKEATDISGSTRDYYTDALNRKFADAERATRFNLARQGLLGGSSDSDQQGTVRSDRDLGATRIDEAVRKAVAALQTQREGERLNAIGLVNAGVGDQAIDSATSGLRTSFSNVNNANKVDLFGDLFAGAADTAASQNVNAANAALAARYKNSLGTFFPTSSGGGKVTATE